MFLKWGAPTSPGMRQKRWTHYDSFFNIRFPKLATKLTRQVGRSVTGRRVVFTKGKQISNFLFKSSAATFQKARILGMVLKVQPNNYRRASSALVRTALGAWYYTKTTQHITTLSYLSVNDMTSTHNLPKPVNWFWQLIHSAPHTKICYVQLPLSKTPVYALAPGSSCLLVTPTLWTGWSFVLLPSKQAKLLNFESWALHGSPSPVFQKTLNCAKATKYQLSGKTSTVRGVAKNPNDHPHGGRTKAVKYPRTPWGRTTKKSRTPALHSKLRPLNKRAIKTIKHTTPIIETLSIDQTDDTGLSVVLWVD